jgi:hypothetical protein
MDYKCICPSGTANKPERELFFTSDLTYILAVPATHLLVGGDFNAILDKADSTGHYKYSRALCDMVQGLAIHDVWQHHPNRRAYNHYSPTNVSRLDRIYLSRGLLDRNLRVETILAPFTDHLAVRLWLTIQQHVPRVGYGYWKLNSDLVKDKHCEAQLAPLWASLIRLRQNYGDDVLWWSRICKTKIRRLHLREQASRRTEQKQMENHLMNAFTSSYIVLITSQTDS